MATGKELWRLTTSRRKTVKILIDAEDWEAAAYMMGYVLETALKAASCKSLNLSEYPDKKSSKNTSSYFMTHNFDQLLTISGFTHIFEASGPAESSGKWSEFLQSYPGDWPRMRYEPNAVFVCDKSSVKKLYGILYSKKNSIIKTIKEVQKW
jgi:hypothetical protein